MQANINKDDYFSNHDPVLYNSVKNAVIGIAGAGGLGSNVAVSLARAGVGKLIIADFDIVEITNLNRQQYFISQIGKKKVEALKANLTKINPFSSYEIHPLKVTSENIFAIFENVNILVECFDLAKMKKMLIENWVEKFPKKPIIAASGLGGVGHNEQLFTRKIDNLYICGDEKTEVISGYSPVSTRVGIVANMQANLVLEILMDKKR